jgi:hypothetical protein
MTVWLATVWGLTGGLCVEALELYAHIRRTPKWNWRRPIDQGLIAYVVAVILRVGVGSALAAAFAGSHQVSGPLAAFTLGVAAPMVVARLAKAVPLTDGEEGGADRHHRSVDAEMARALAAKQTSNGHDPVVQDVAAGESDAR